MTMPDGVATGAPNTDDMQIGLCVELLDGAVYLTIRGTRRRRRRAARGRN